MNQSVSFCPTVGRLRPEQTACLQHQRGQYCPSGPIKFVPNKHSRHGHSNRKSHGSQRKPFQSSLHAQVSSSYWPVVLSPLVSWRNGQRWPKRASRQIVALYAPVIPLSSVVMALVRAMSLSSPTTCRKLS